LLIELALMLFSATNPVSYEPTE